MHVRLLRALGMRGYHAEIKSSCIDNGSTMDVRLRDRTNEIAVKELARESLRMLQGRHEAHRHNAREEHRGHCLGRDRMTESTIAKRDVGVPRLRVLIADDDEETLRTVTAAVELLGADVTRATTGGELVEYLGAERTAGLRTPVVVITALRVPSVSTQTSTLGENAVLLHKPFCVEDLHTAIRAVLGHPVVAADHSGGTAP